MKMYDFGVISFIISHQANIFANLADKWPGFKGLTLSMRRTDISVWCIMYWEVIEIFNFNLHHNLSNSYTHIYDEVPGLGGVGGRMVGKIIALKPIGNMTKMTDFGVK